MPHKISGFLAQSVSFVTTENGQAISTSVYYKCSLDGTPWRRCSSPFNAATKHQGYNNLRVKAVVVKAHINVRPARVSWLVSLQPPLTASSPLVNTSPPLPASHRTSRRSTIG